MRWFIQSLSLVAVLLCSCQSPPTVQRLAVTESAISSLDPYKVELKYKSLWVDYEEGTKGTSSYFSYDAATHGPILSLAYEF